MSLFVILCTLFTAIPGGFNTRIPHSLAQDAVLRIGLTRSFGGATPLTVVCPASVRLTDPLDSSLLDGPGEWKVSARDNEIVLADREGKVLISGPVIRLVPNTDADFRPIEISSGQTRRRYRGVVEFQPGSAKGTVLTINELPLEDYLRGVVPAEMSDSAPLEALKAQTIAARSYALINRGRYKVRGFDLSDAPDCQVYNGVGAEKPATDRAVRETVGQVLVRNGSLVLADYYDDCGGVTSSGDGAGDYPPSVQDAEEGGPDYCSKASSHSWSLRLTPLQISSLLSATERIRVGDIVDLAIDTIDPSGRAVEVLISGTQGEIRLKGTSMRGRIGYSRMKSTLITLSKNGDGSFEMDGKGFGHGHGLCQAGAIGMASAPYSKTCAEILEHYFPGSDVTEFDGQGARPQRNPDEPRVKSPSRGVPQFPKSVRRPATSLRSASSR